MFHIRQFPAIALKDDTHAKGGHHLLLDLLLCRLTADVLSHLPIEVRLLCDTVIMFDESDNLVDTHCLTLRSLQRTEEAKF